MRPESEILDNDILPLRSEAAVRIINLLYGTNEEDDNIHQILDSVLLEAYIRGRKESTVVINNMNDIRKAIEEKVLEVYGGEHRSSVQ